MVAINKLSMRSWLGVLLVVWSREQPICEPAVRCVCLLDTLNDGDILLGDAYDATVFYCSAVNLAWYLWVKSIRNGMVLTFMQWAGGVEQAFWD